MGGGGRPAPIESCPFDRRPRPRLYGPDPMKEEKKAKEKAAAGRRFHCLGTLFAFGRLGERTIGAGAHANLDHLAVDVDAVLLEIGIPDAAGRTDAVAAVVAAEGTFSGNRADS